VINGGLLRDAVISAAHSISNKKKSVDELNVFPVPDGDTGTNMSMTITNSVAELENLSDGTDCSVVASTTASALLRGARGNSGVILSLIFRGFAKGLAGKKEMGANELVESLEQGVSGAYKSVMKPTEGTVVTHGNIVPMLELGSGFDMDLSGRENIYLNGSILGYSKEFLDEKFDEILEFSELGEFIEQPIRNYSSGMLMRLAFSVATIVNPEILIVDEILAVGDADFQEKSKNKMLDLMSGGTTVLFVSHMISQIREMCDTVVWLDHGKVKMIGGAKEVCDAYQFKKSENDELSKLYFDDGTGFNERATFTQVMPMDGNIFKQVYEFPTKCQHVRYDPVEGTTISLSDLKIVAEDANVNIIATNGRQVDDVFYFGKDDPWIDMSFSHGVSSVEITGVVREVNEDAM